MTFWTFICSSFGKSSFFTVFTFGIRFFISSRWTFFTFYCACFSWNTSIWTRRASSCTSYRIIFTYLTRFTFIMFEISKCPRWTWFTFCMVWIGCLSIWTYLPMTFIIELTPADPIESSCRCLAFVLTIYRIFRPKSMIWTVL